MNRGDLNKVWEIKALKKPGEDEAKKMLEKIAKQVQPIMSKHNWRVKLLSEFCPKNSSLLGLNVGAGVQVKLRLRRPNRDFDFYPYDQVLDTMLHELCHNAHGPHNASFYKLWDELRKECEELMAKGITGTGEGFDLPGKRLGGFSRQPPLSSLRQTALTAAEKRVRLGSLLPSGPKRLGGDSTIMVALSPVQAAAMAAERRLQDEIWCGSASCEDAQEGETSSDLIQGQSAGTSRLSSGSPPFVDLSIDASSLSESMLTHDERSQKRSRESDKISISYSFYGRPESNFVDLTMGASTSGSMLNYNMEEPLMWECGTCTLLNPPLAPLCEICGTHKPKDTVSKHKFWSCKFCTLENSVKLEKCSVCGEWRYSHGPPVSTMAPNLGT